MIMGQYAASNILKYLDWQQRQQQQQQQQQDRKEEEEEEALNTAATTSNNSSPTPGPGLLRCPDFEPMMALSVGDEAVAYTEASGVIWGKEIKEKLIGRGLGIDSECCRFGLGWVAGRISCFIADLLLL
jgi:hypothetical protein